MAGGQGSASYSDGIYGDGPSWVPDKEAPDCGICHDRFTKNPLRPRRRHHCRLCGTVVCQACSESRVEFLNKLERACTRCAQAAPQLNRVMPFLNDLDIRLNNIRTKSDGVMCKNPPRKLSMNSNQVTASEEDVRAMMEKLNEAAAKLEEAFHSRNQSFAASSVDNSQPNFAQPAVDTRPAPTKPQEEEPAPVRQVMDFSVGEDDENCKCTNKCVIS